MITENTTIREFLQTLGTECMRNTISDNIWVAALMADYKDVYIGDWGQGNHMYKKPDWIVTDVRFPNEAEAIKKNGGIMIRVDKPGVEAINNHPSETSLNDWKFDYKVVNISDIYTLKTTIENILKHANIL